MRVVFLLTEVGVGVTLKRSARHAHRSAELPPCGAWQLCPVLKQDRVVLGAGELSFCFGSQK